MTAVEIPVDGTGLPAGKLADADFLEPVITREDGICAILLSAPRAKDVLIETAREMGRDGLTAPLLLCTADRAAVLKPFADGVEQEVLERALNISGPEELSFIGRISANGAVSVSTLPPSHQLSGLVPAEICQTFLERTLKPFFA